MRRQAEPRTGIRSAEATWSDSGPPLRRERTFSPHGSSVSEARKFAVEVLSPWGVRDRLDDVCLCLSEVAFPSPAPCESPRSMTRGLFVIWSISRARARSVP